MKRKIVFEGALISGMLSGAAVGYFNVRDTAYVPSLAAPSLSNHPMEFAICMGIALAAAFAITLLANRIGRRKNQTV